MRGLLKGLGTALGEAGSTVGEWRLVAETVAEPALAAVEEMIFKEEKILLPMALQNLTETEWGEIWAQSPEFGYCLVDPREGYRPPERADDLSDEALSEAERKGAAFAGEARASEPTRRGKVVLPSGVLGLDQLEAILETLPVDITFVDAEDRVRFFSEGKSRVFERPKAILGRLVQHCHPPGSVDVVERILDDFRAGRQDVAEFWIELRGRFVHIRYFALRDEEGGYLGTLEVTQDLTHERSLEGERRLLHYEG